MTIKRIIKSIKIINKLLNSKKYYFKELKPSSLQEIPAVYAIFNKDHCYFQYIPENDTQLRGQIEGLLGYMLDVYYIHE